MATKRQEKTSFIKDVARLVSQKGLETEKTLVALNKDNGEKFSFLLRSDPYHAYYQDKLNYYRKEVAQVTSRPHAPPATASHNCSVADDGEEEAFCLLPTYSTLWSSSFSRPPGISLKDLYIMKLTAQFIARYDMHFLRALKEHVAQNPKPQFDFLKPTSSRFKFCGGLVRGYASVIRPYIESLMRDGGGIMPLVLPPGECWTRYDDYDDMPLCLQFFFDRLQLEKLEAGDEMALIDLHAFVSGVDFFAQRDNDAFATVMSTTPHLSKMMYEWPQMQPSKLVSDDDTEPELIDAPRSYEILEKQLTLKELGIIKLTAMFVARYGSEFRRDLMEVVLMNPLFEFLQPSDCKCSKFFSSLVRVYSTVIMPSDKLWYGDDSTAFALEFFSRTLQLEKLENGDETAAIDLHALVGGVDCFSHMSESLFLAFAPQPEHLSTMVKRRGCQLLTEFHKADDENLDGTDQPDGVARPYRFKSSFKFPEKGITVRELGVIMLTAQFVQRYGEKFRLGLRRRVVMNTQFGFMVFGDRRHYFYCGLLCAYRSVLRPCKRMKRSAAYTDTVLDMFFEILQSQEGERIGLHDFVGLVDWFAHVEEEYYSVVVPAPVHVLMNMIPPTLRLPNTLLLPPMKPSVTHDPAQRRHDHLASPAGRSTLREEYIIKVTAQFVVRYGTSFERALRRRVAETPKFEFMKPTGRKFRLYASCVEGFAQVLEPCKKRVDCMDTVLEGLFCFLDREHEEAVGIGLHGFVDVVDCFASMDHVVPQCLIPPGCQVHLGQPSTGMMKQPAPPTLGVMSSRRPLPEEPEPMRKRGKKRERQESALDPQDHSHAKHPRLSTTITVFVPNVGEVKVAG
ncbi:uncharacterized protein LOC130494249 [Raphanus sativus]|uniref:Uncharacterized protein LOC108839623 n=1 Tax=Raphanus sativus TaxID=3726 RepID=A0A6J0M5Z5_RAPSA|nr:uncharacterized protein LOC108839623 [Raphanus sativus]XP_056858907.1 uncharacterized protein LOC130494249 [Raphanus sativus]XP_056858908.1 uncharacterized protein LOC130494249 [Raphanus sativus]